MLCAICNRAEVFSEDPERDWCLCCWMTGRYFERSLASEERANMLPRIRELEHVAVADVWHFGNGAFNLGIMLDDGRLITPGAPGMMLGQAVVVPFIPPAGGEWAVMVSRQNTDPVEGEAEWSNSPTILPDLYDDDGLVRLIAEIS